MASGAAVARPVSKFQIYLDIIVRPADLSLFLAGLLDFIAQPARLDWRLLDLHNLPESSSTLPALQAEAKKRGLGFQPGSHLPRSFHPIEGRF